MCDIARERKKIDALIDLTISPFWFEDAGNERALVEYSFKCVHEEYCFCCTEDGIRARCEAYVALRLRRMVA